MIQSIPASRRGAALRRKLVPLVLLAIVCAGPVSAQVERAWTFGYDTPGNRPQIPTELVPLPDGGVVAVQTEGGPFGMGEAFVTKFTVDGDRDWVFRAPVFVGLGFVVEGGVHADADDVGNVYVTSMTGSTGELTKIGPDGTVAWTLPIDASASTYWPARVLVDPAGGVIVAGTRDVGLYPFIRLVRYDANGQRLWLGDGFQGTVQSLRRAPNGDLVTFGQDDYNGFEHAGLSMSFAADGTYLWHNTIRSGGYLLSSGERRFADTIDAEFVDSQGITHSATNGPFGITQFGQVGVQGFRLGGLNSLGHVVYGVSVSAYNGTSPGETLARAIVVDSQSALFVVGSESDCPSGCDRIPAIWRFDTSGNIVWTRRPAASAGIAGELLGVRIDAAGNLIASGYREGASSAGFEVAFAPDGTELWSLDRPGSAPAPGNSWTGKLARFPVRADARGNSFVVGSLQDRIIVTKLIEGGPVGIPYCGPAATNSTGVPATIRAAGSGFAADDNVTVLVADMPVGSFVLFLASRTQGMVPNLGGGQGALCLGGAIGRYVGLRQIRRAGNDGATSLQLDLDTIPQPTGLVVGLVGETWNIQAWYRDANPGVTSNLTNAVSMTLQ